MTTHPAKYNDKILSAIEDLLPEGSSVIDVMAGTGRIFELERLVPGVKVTAIELEPEWAALHPRTQVGNALSLPFPDGSFDFVVTSPCLTSDQRILTADLRWVPAGDIVVGQKLIAFDEYPTGYTANGRSVRRKWRIATVEESYPARKECVRVNMENGESVTCTVDHPWLASKYLYSAGSEWVEARDLMKLYSPHVYRQLSPWSADLSYESGWLAGMFDGEGSLSFGVHGCPKLMIVQVDGEVSDLVGQRLELLKIKHSTISRKDTIANRQQVTNTYVNGGFPGILEALGRLRPARLLAKLEQLDVKSRCISAEKVRVTSVEEIGIQDIQGIQTSTGTYIGEGYLHHNTYGNRMSDHYNQSDSSKRYTYKSSIGRDLHPDNAGRLQWGDKYRDFHLKAWTEAVRVIAPKSDTKETGFILNVKDHVRNGVVQPVSGWHVSTLIELGLTLEKVMFVECSGNRHGRNSEARVPFEYVFKFVR